MFIKLVLALIISVVMIGCGVVDNMTPKQVGVEPEIICGDMPNIEQQMPDGNFNNADEAINSDLLAHFRAYAIWRIECEGDHQSITIPITNYVEMVKFIDMIDEQIIKVTITELGVKLSTNLLKSDHF